MNQDVLYTSSLTLPLLCGFISAFFTNGRTLHTIQTMIPVTAIADTFATTPGRFSGVTMAFPIQTAVGAQIKPPRTEAVSSADTLGPYSGMTAGGAPTTVINVFSHVTCGSANPSMYRNTKSASARESTWDASTHGNMVLLP